MKEPMRSISRKRTVPGGAVLTRAVLLWALAIIGCGGDDDPVDGSGGGPDVVVVGDGEAVVSWDAPSTRSDGTGLMPASLGGYRVHYGTAPRTYDTTIDVGRVTSHRVTGLTTGTRYYFAVTAYDISDRESEFSEEVSKDF